MTERVFLLGGPYDGRIAHIEPGQRWGWFAASLVMPDEPPVRYRRYGLRRFGMEVFGLDFEDYSRKTVYREG